MVLILILHNFLSLVRHEFLTGLVVIAATMLKRKTISSVTKGLNAETCSKQRPSTNMLLMFINLGAIAT